MSERHKVGVLERAREAGWRKVRGRNYKVSGGSDSTLHSAAWRGPEGKGSIDARVTDTNCSDTKLKNKAICVNSTPSTDLSFNHHGRI